MADQESRDEAAGRRPRERGDQRSPRGGDDRGARKPYQRNTGDRSAQQRDAGSSVHRGERKPYREGDRPYAKREGDRPYAKPEGDRPYAKRDGDRPYAKREGDRPYAKRDGDRPYAKRDGDRPYAKRDGDRPYAKREGDRPYAKRDGDRPFAKREGDRPYAKRDGDRPYAKREGDRPYAKREGDRPYAKREGDRPYARREGDRPYARREGDRPYARREGDRPYARREGDRPYAKRDGDRPYARREGDTGDARRPRPTRGGAGRPDRAVREGEIRPVRPRHDDPAIPEEITPRDLNPSARNELRTLSKENADEVARHLAMASRLIDEDPELAHQHALSASRRAGRIAVVRETLAITAYATGDYALALRELRTYRRISGKDDQIALMVDSERGVGRPDRALEVGRSVDRSSLPTAARVELAIAMSGARLDLGEPDRALLELDIPELDPDRAFEWSPGLFAARAAVLEDLGRHDEAAQWRERAEVAAEVLDAASGLGDLETVLIEEVGEEFDDASVENRDSIEEEDPSFEGDGSSFEEDDSSLEEDASPAEGDAELDEEQTAASRTDDIATADDADAFSVEDEVAEILSDAGIDTADEPSAGSDGSETDATGPEGDR